MGRLSNIKNWFGLKIDKMTKLSDMDRIDVAVNELSARYSEIRETLAMAEGEVKYDLQIVAKSEESLKRIEKAARLIVEKKEATAESNVQLINQYNESLRVLHSDASNLTNVIATRKQSIQLQLDVIAKLTRTSGNIQTKLNEVRQLKSQLEIKNQFTETMKKYEGFIAQGSDFNIDEALKSIEVKFNAANFKFEEYDKDLQLEEVIAEANDSNDVDSWINSLK